MFERAELVVSECESGVLLAFGWPVLVAALPAFASGVEDVKPVASVAVNANGDLEGLGPGVVEGESVVA
jgi:hypothetical protein